MLYKLQIRKISENTLTVFSHLQKIIYLKKQMKQNVFFKVKVKQSLFQKKQHGFKCSPTQKSTYAGTLAGAYA